MSAIFKTRKVPRHLIIDPEVPLLKRRRRWHIPRLMLLLALVLVSTWALLQLG